jgi:tripartite-type tricarboxylate transporter receptor subunit TctC
MTVHRMSLFATMALSLVVGVSYPINAQIYPNQPIKIIVAAAPGGPSDIPARLASQILQPKLGQPVVIENRGGGGGVIGVREVIKSPPNGYTLLSAGGAQLAVVPALSASANYDPTKDLAPVAKFMESFQILVVHPSSPWKSIKDLIADAKANPGKFNFAHVGNGHLTHLAGEMFMASTGTKLTGVPYRSGGESATAVLSQAVHMTFENSATLLPLILDTKLRALAVTSRTRSPFAPDIPTMIESGVADYEVTTFFGIMAPTSTPIGIISKLNAEMNEGLRTAEMQILIAKMGAISQPASPEDFGKTIATQMARWKSLGKISNVKID